MTLTTSPPNPSLQSETVQVSFSLSLGSPLVQERQQSRQQESRRWRCPMAVYFIANEISDPILSFPMCFLLPPFFTVHFLIYQLTIISKTNFHYCCTLHCRHNWLNCIVYHPISRTSYVQFTSLELLKDIIFNQSFHDKNQYWERFSHSPNSQDLQSVENLQGIFPTLQM